MEDTKSASKDNHMKFEDMSDMDLSNWKNLDITTNSAWFSRHEVHPVPTIKKLPPIDQTFHGVFIPYIPYQMIKRFTKPGEIIWDCFAGSGTTWLIAKLLGRQCIANDIISHRPYILEADSATFDPHTNVQLIFMHPPYYNIIKYEGDHRLSGASDLKEFLAAFGEIAYNVVKFLDDDRILILVCGNVYLHSEEVTLGCLCKDIIRQLGFRLRSHIVKGYGETKGGWLGRNKALNRYRGLKFGFNSFYGDNIFILQKHASKNFLLEQKGLGSP